METLTREVRQAWRALAAQPVFTTVAALTLAIGIGSTTAIFSVVHGIVLKPLPYEQPGQLVQVWEAPRPGSQNYVSPGVFLDWRAHSRQFEDFAAWGTVDLNLNGEGDPERLPGLRMSASALKILRARPILGRIFDADEDQPGKAKVVVLTHQLWQRAFSGATDVVGRSIELNRERYTVIGVLPRGFLPVEQSQFVIPWIQDARWREMRGGHFMRVYARLRPGVTFEQGRAELEAITEQIRPLFPGFKKDWGVNVTALNEQLARDLKPALFVLLASVVLVLLIACANVANLLLARASGRQREIAVRAALGAGRGRIMRQCLCESVLLAGIGAMPGLGLALWGTAALRNLITGMNYPRAHEISLDGTVLAAALGVVLLTGLGFGLAPAWQAARTDLSQVLRDGSRGSSSGSARVRRLLIVVEVALSLVLLSGAALLVQSYSRLMRVSPGFTASGAFSLQLSLADAKYPDNARRVAFFNQLTRSIEHLPGVEAAGVGGVLPLAGGVPDTFFRIVGRADHPEPGYLAEYDSVTPGFFRALGMTLRRGRLFEQRDADEQRHLAVINESMATRYFPGEDPVGRVVSQGDQNYEIIGIVADVRTRGLMQSVRAMIYRVRPQDNWRSATLVVRHSGPAAPVVDAVRRVTRELDPAQPLANFRTLEDVVAASVAERRLTMVLLALFAGTALLLAAVGLYGVIAFAVAERTREMGIRMALGATAPDVLKLVLSEGVRLVAIGVLVGVAASLGLTHLLSRLLYETPSRDPASLLAVIGVLLVTALFASWIPARRATAVNPIEALRAS